MKYGLWLDRGFIGLRLGRWYFKLRDVERHPLLFSERNSYGYRRILRFRLWEFGVRRDAPSAREGAGR